MTNGVFYPRVLFMETVYSFHVTEMSSQGTIIFFFSNYFESEPLWVM